jgi:hypothetical protein
LEEQKGYPHEDGYQYYLQTTLECYLPQPRRKRTSLRFRAAPWFELKILHPGKDPDATGKKTLTKLRSAERLRTWLYSKDMDDNEEGKNEYIPGLYLPSTWVIPIAPPYIENGLAAFEGKLKDHLEQHKPDREDNLTFYQRRAMKKLKNDPAIHICDT